MPTWTSAPDPITYNFTDDGRIPNNPCLPLVLYRGGIDLVGSPDPEAVIEKTLAANGWGNMWRNGIYPYVHYHSMIHEAMGIARGRATVRFGGENVRMTRAPQFAEHTDQILRELGWSDDDIIALKIDGAVT